MKYTNGIWLGGGGGGSGEGVCVRGGGMSWDETKLVELVKKYKKK